MAKTNKDYFEEFENLGVAAVRAALKGNKFSGRRIVAAGKWLSEIDAKKERADREHEDIFQNEQIELARSAHAVAEDANDIASRANALAERASKYSWIANIIAALAVVVAVIAILK